MTAAAEALESGDSTLASGETQLGSTLRRLARGALLGARGNSGVILSQLFKGLAEALAASPSADGRALAAALDRAAREAYRAVAAPVEGTVLSVGAAAAAAALEAAAAGDVPPVVGGGWTAGGGGLAVGGAAVGGAAVGGAAVGGAAVGGA